MTAPAGPFIGKGTTLSTSPDGTTYTPLGAITNIEPPQVTCGEAEVTAYGDSIENYIPGWQNGGELDAEINYAETQSATLYALLGTPNEYFKIQFPDGSGPTTGTTLIFQGFLKSIGQQIPLKNAIKTKIKIRVNTKPLYTAPS